MSNLDKANEVASKWVESMGGLEAIRHDHGSDLSGLMQALDDAGLLMPDLPEPTKLNRRNEPIWETEGHTRVRTPGGFPVALNGPFGEGWDMFPVEARDIAYALLAACDYVEKEQGNE